nr:vitamin B12 transporter BtuB [uncultured bacterium]
MPGATQSRTISALFASLLLTLLATTAHAQIRLDLPAQPLSQSLTAVGTQGHLNVMFDPSVVDGLQAPALRAELSADDALGRLLSGTKLHAVRVDANTIRVIAEPGAKRVQTTETSETSALHTRQGVHFAYAGSASELSTSSQLDNSPNESSGPGSPLDKKREPVTLEEVVVTGSRIGRAADEGAQDVRIYSREQIERSGQTTVSDFLNTLPSVSIAVQESGQLYGVPASGTTVQLRGLPVGSTLVLINGHRVETSGTESRLNFFDLSNIPLAAVERIEVVANGSSAIYGSDAIAGVVNVILKEHFNGVEVNAKYGAASALSDSNVGIALGKLWKDGNLSIVGSYQSRGDLRNRDRAITASNDYTHLGGPNNNLPECSPGNVYFPNGYSFNGGSPVQYAAVPSNSAGKPSLQEFAAMAGSLNTCSITAPGTLVPRTERFGLLISGDYKLTESVTLFGELLASHLRQYSYSTDAWLFGLPGYQQYTASASNPYNPFGVDVGVSEDIAGFTQGEIDDTTFVRPLFGVRGSAGTRWSWELSALLSDDFTVDTLPNTLVDNAGIQAALDSTNPASALNPFIRGPLGTQAQLQSFFHSAEAKYRGQSQEINGFLRGRLLDLPAGPLEVVIGGEYDRNVLYSNLVEYPGYAPQTRARNTRHTTAIFGEARVPLLAGTSSGRRYDKLAFTMAGRYDKYNDFGSTSNPQFGLEWRPFRNLLIRGTYAEAFKAPSLYDLYTPRTTVTPGYAVTDPKTGQLLIVPALTGGNGALRPEGGSSESIGIVYTSETIPNIKASLTQWQVKQTHTIENLQAQFIVNNEGSFPGRVSRDPTTGAITLVDITILNFGALEVAGLDYHVSYQQETPLGEFSTAMNVTQTYKFDTQLVPGAPPVDSVSTASTAGWAPRWKGIALAGWKLRGYSVNVDGRYVGRYRDYSPLPSGRYLTLGNFWLLDLQLKCDVGDVIDSAPSWAKGMYVEAGGTNVLNRLPQYSTFFPYLGFDPAQADIRGRFLYVQAGMRW